MTLKWKPRKLSPHDDSLMISNYIEMSTIHRTVPWHYLQLKEYTLIYSVLIVNSHIYIFQCLCLWIHYRIDFVMYRPIQFMNDYFNIQSYNCWKFGPPYIKINSKASFSCFKLIKTECTIMQFVHLEVRATQMPRSESNRP